AAICLRRVSVCIQRLHSSERGRTAWRTARNTQMEELRLIAGATRTPPLTMRDLLAVIFRQLRVVTISLLVVLLACFGYRLLSPSYRAEMKVLISRGRVDPAVT